ncbi:PPE family protein, partial [Mycobacterium sp. WUMAC-067]|nr:PPE family protein [Mycobacterium sp. WUMAC-067]
ALSVPQTWASAAPAMSSAATALPSTSLATAPGATTGAPASMLGAPLATMAGRGIGNVGETDLRFMPRLTVLPPSTTLG